MKSLNTWNIVGAVAVLICSLVVSFTHTLALFRSGGFSGGLEWVAAAGVEITFIMAALNLVVATLQKRRIRWPIKLGGFLGLAVVGWSNISAGWAYGLPGVVLGAVIPLSLYSAKSILSDAVLNLSPTSNQSPVDQETFFVEQEIINQPPNALASRPTKEETLEKKPTNRQSANQPEKEEASTFLEEQPTTSPTTPYEWAAYFHNLDGEPPTRRRLMEATGCTDWAARTAIKKLKQEIGA